MQNFIEDGVFWHFLAYCRGGRSILIIGSAAGVAFMGLEKVPFGWYLKRISLIALLGYTLSRGLYPATGHLLTIFIGRVEKDKKRQNLYKTVSE